MEILLVYQILSIDKIMYIRILCSMFYVWTLDVLELLICQPVFV